MKFRMNGKVKIISNKKVDGRYNYGTILGIEKIQDDFYLGYTSEKEFLSRYTQYKYKVVYIDCVTQRANEEWFHEDDLEKK